MKPGLARRMILVIAGILAAGLDARAPGDEPAKATPFQPRTRVGVSRDVWTINDELVVRDSQAEGLLMNVRMVNAVFEDSRRPEFDPTANTAAFVARIPEYSASGVTAFTVGLQGGFPGYEGAVNSAFLSDGSLAGPYFDRVRQVIEACDRQGTIVILSCFYQRQDQILEGDQAIRRGVVNVANLIRERGFTNVVLEIANEFPHAGFDHRLIRSEEGEVELIKLARMTAPGLLVSTSGMGDGKCSDKVAEAADYLLIHFNGVNVEQIPARIAALKRFHKPIVCNEDATIGLTAARAAKFAVSAGGAWGFMAEQQNQHFPFKFAGVADDPLVYAELRRLAAPYPGKAWSREAPDAVGLQTNRLDQLAGLAGGSGCIIRHGRLVYSWGDIARRSDIASAAKPWYAHFLALAIASGKIKSFDSQIAESDPRLNDLNPQLAFKDHRMTWRQLVNQTSCYGVREFPGEAFDYSDFNMALLFDTLFLKVYGTTWKDVDRDVLRPLLADLIGCEDQPTFMAFGSGDRAGRMGISVRDLARFGLLYLHRGNWRGKQILDEKLLTTLVSNPLPANFARTAGDKAEMLAGQRSIGGGNNQTDHWGSYSFAWWTNGSDRHGKRHWPGAPLDAYAALGHGGERALVIIPSLDLVVAWNDARINDREKQNEAIRLIVGAAELRP